MATSTKDILLEETRMLDEERSARLKSDPEFSAMVEEAENQPERAVARLRKLHRRKDSMFREVLYEIIDALADQDDESDLWGRYLNAGISGVLVDAAMDADMYVKINDASIGYIWDIYDSLTTCAEGISHRVNDPNLASATETIARDFIKRTNKLWAFLWARYAVALRRPEVYAAVTTIDVCEEINSLAYTTFEIREVYNIPIKASDLLMQVLLYTWVYTEESLYDLHVVTAGNALWAFLKSEQVQSGPSGSAAYPREWRRIIDDLATREVTLVTLVDRVSTALSARFSIDKSLVDLVAWFYNLTIGYPTFFQISKDFRENGDDNLEKEQVESVMILSRALVQSCQRQVCKGDARHEAELFAWSTRTLMQIWPPDEGESFCSIVFVCSEETIKFMEFLAHALPLCVGHATHDFFESAMGMLQMIQQMEQGVAQYILLYRPSPPLTKFLLSAKRLHQPILDELRIMPPTAVPNAEFESFRQEAMNIWAETCTKLEKLVDGVPDRNAEGDPDCWNSRKHCYNPTCSCYDPDPAYGCQHAMRVCKGCWRVFYCNTKCQTKDWSRHRAFCQRTRAKEGR